MTNVKAQSKWVRVGKRKLMQIMELVRGKSAVAALELLRFRPQKSARIIEKVIKSAIANAKNNFKLAEQELVIVECYANKGVTMKRWQPRARGRMFPIKKPTSHVTVCVAAPPKKVREGK